MFTKSYLEVDNYKTLVIENDDKRWTSDLFYNRKFNHQDENAQVT